MVGFLSLTHTRIGPEGTFVDSITQRQAFFLKRLAPSWSAIYFLFSVHAVHYLSFQSFVLLFYFFELLSEFVVDFLEVEQLLPDVPILFLHELNLFLQE